MARVTKATRRFEHKHLHKVLEDRKAKAKVKQQFQIREKKKLRRKEDRGDNQEPNDDGEENPTPLAKQPKGKEAAEDGLFGDMSVEQFFQGGFEVPEKKKDKKGKKDKSQKRKRDEEEEKEAVVEDEGEEGGSDSDDEMAKHAKDLKALADKDPEFYKYLQENDTELLDFANAENEDLDEIDNLSSEDEKPGKKGKKDKKADSNVVKLADVKKWNEALIKEKSLRALRQVVLAFRAASHQNDVEEEKTFKYSITSPDVYHELLVLALREVPEVLKHHLPVKESSSGRIRVSTDTKKFKTLTPLIKLHSSSLLHLLPTLTDDATLKLLLASTMELLPYFVTFRKFLKSFINAIVEVWSTHSVDEATKIMAFLVVRKAINIGDEGLKEIAVKSLYAGLVKASRATSNHTVQGINLMKNSASEIFGMPGMEKVAYQLGFGYIRQLAIHLRNSTTKKTKDSYKTIYNWQYVHSLDFWSRVLSLHCDGLQEAQAGKESNLRPLIYPLVQVTLGAIRLIPTAQYFPLRFFLMRSLLRLSLQTGVFIPLASLVFEVLASKEIKSKPKPSTLKPIDFSITIRAPKAYLRTRTYQDGIAEQVVELLSEFYVLYTKSVAFPELSIPTVVLLKRFMKKSKNSKFNGALQLLVSKLDQNSKWIQDKRNNIDFAPDKREEVEGFLKGVDWEKTPLGAYVNSQRKVREEKRKMLEESQKEERHSKGRRDEDESEDEMMPDAESEEDEDEDDDDEMNG